MIIYNNKTAYRMGLIEELLLKSYEGVADTNKNDRESFSYFDEDLNKHPEWLGVHVFITTVDEAPAGFVSFDPRKRPVAEIGHNCILPEYRGKGLGKEQLKRGLEEIKKQGFTNVIVSTGATEDFIPAQKMYSACGFAEIERFYKEEGGIEMIAYALQFS